MEGSAVLDFHGTGYEVRGNLNAPISVVHSAVIYCMRSMLDVDIPLNAGCLVPLDSAFFFDTQYSKFLVTIVQSEFPRSRYSHLPVRQRYAAGMS